jgi:predicted nucleic acid-binding protein
VTISAINLAEIVDVMTRIYRRTPAETLDALALLESGGLRVAPVDADLGLAAGALHAQHYDRRTSALSMADCVALATARALEEPLATSDPSLAAAATASGVEIMPLPDSHGRLP